MTHDYREPRPDQPTIDLGHDVQVAFTSYAEHDKAGLLVYHRNHEHPDQPCLGSILFDLPGIRDNFPSSAVWTLNSLDPLDVAPSLLCSCGHHGFIHGGRWEPA